MAEPAWTFVAALPGLDARQGVECGDTAVVPRSDSRASASSLSEHAKVIRYLSQFRGIDGAPVPSLLIIRRARKKRINSDDLTFLRNCLAVSVLLLARAHRCRRHFMTGPTFSDAFDLPPAWLRIGRGVVVETPAVLAGGSTEIFCGHPSPTYPFGHSEIADLDETLLDALLSVWRSKRKGPAGVFRRRIARLLEIAYLAMRAPAGNLSSGNDWGVSLALWVSAFETIANSAGAVKFTTVQALVEQVPWPPSLRRPLTAYEWRSPIRRDKALRPMMRPVQVYARLYRARNMVLHGEEYERGRLEPGRRHKSWGPLHLEAAVLFRCLLLHTLAKSGHGRYLTQPTSAEIGAMNLGAALARWRDVGLAHDPYLRAFGRGLNPRPR